MKQHHKYVGLDVHKERNEVAIADSTGEVRVYGAISNDLHALEKLVVKLRGDNVVLHFVYEAGPCGFVIQRRLQQLGEDCVVVAPSLVPKKSGDRVKTDRRDAVKLARLHRAGELTGIHIPDPRDEAIRDLIRARTDAVTDRRDNRHRLKAFLLRHGYKYAGKSSWTEPHLRYLRELVLADPAHKVVLEEYLLAITQATDRIERLETHIATLATTWRMKPVVDALQGLRGVQLLTAVALAAELGDLSRFRHPRQLMAFLGLVPSEYSSGEGRRQGSITKAGKIKAVFHPMTFIGPESILAANAAACASNAGKFLEYHTALYANQSKTENSGLWNSQVLTLLGVGLGITDKNFASCVKKSTYTGWTSLIETDATKQGVNSTPTVFVNGKLMPTENYLDNKKFAAYLVAAGMK